MEHRDPQEHAEVVPDVHSIQDFSTSSETTAATKDCPNFQIQQSLVQKNECSTVLLPDNVQSTSESKPLNQSSSSPSLKSEYPVPDEPIDKALNAPATSQSSCSKHEPVSSLSTPLKSKDSLVTETVTSTAGGKKDASHPSPVARLPTDSNAPAKETWIATASRMLKPSSVPSSSAHSKVSKSEGVCPTSSASLTAQPKPSKSTTASGHKSSTSHGHSSDAGVSRGHSSNASNGRGNGHNASVSREHGSNGGISHGHSRAAGANRAHGSDASIGSRHGDTSTCSRHDGTTSVKVKEFSHPSVAVPELLKSCTCSASTVSKKECSFCTERSTRKHTDKAKEQTGSSHHKRPIADSTKTPANSALQSEKKLERSGGQGDSGKVSRDEKPRASGDASIRKPKTEDPLKKDSSQDAPNSDNKHQHRSIQKHDHRHTSTSHRTSEDEPKRKSAASSSGRHGDHHSEHHSNYHHKHHHSKDRSMEGGRPAASKNIEHPKGMSETPISTKHSENHDSKKPSHTARHDQHKSSQHDSHRSKEHDVAKQEAKDKSSAMIMKEQSHHPKSSSLSPVQSKTQLKPSSKSVPHKSKNGDRSNTTSHEASAAKRKLSFSDADIPLKQAKHRRSPDNGRNSGKHESHRTEKQSFSKIKTENSNHTGVVTDGAGRSTNGANLTEFDYQHRLRSKRGEDSKFARQMFIEESANGGATIVHSYQDEISRLSGEEMSGFVQEFLKEVFYEEREGVPCHVMGVVHGGAASLPDFIDYFADLYPEMIVKRQIMGKSDVETTNMALFREMVHSTYAAGTYRCGPLLQISLVGKKSEETGGFFPEFLDLLETNPFVGCMMPWGELSSLFGAERDQSNDGPILWSRPGEQVIPTADLPKSPMVKKR